MDYAREKGIGLDFNPTYFSHPMLRDNWTLASPEKEVRDFWVQHGIACRKIGEYFGRELGEVCITNHWIPDGSKDTRVDTLGPRERLVESLDRIFAEPLDRKYNRDSIEGKVFGLGLESYTAGSHEFYTNYALTTGKAMVCMDTGHYHPTESVAAKLSSYFVFGQEIMTHLSRAVRWDSDHVATVSEDTVAIMQEIKRCNAFDKVHLGLDFFDASIDRVSASVIGARSVKKALMIALLEPTDKLMEAEREGNFTRRLALLEEFKMLPAGIVFDEYCGRARHARRGLGGEALSRRFIIDTDTGSDDAGHRRGALRPRTSPCLRRSRPCAETFRSISAPRTRFWRRTRREAISRRSTAVWSTRCSPKRALRRTMSTARTASAGLTCPHRHARRKRSTRCRLSSILCAKTPARSRSLPSAH